MAQVVIEYIGDSKSAVEAADKLRKSLEKIQDVSAGVSTSARSVGQSFESAGRSSQGFFSTLMSRAAGYAMGEILYNIADGVTRGMKEMIFGLNAFLESSTAQFTALMGSAELASAKIQEITQFAAKSPMDTEELVKASKYMQVFGGTAFNTMSNLQLFANAALATGAPLSNMTMWVSRLYQNLMAGRPFGEAVQNLYQLGAISPQVVAKMNELKEAGASGAEQWQVYADYLGQYGSAVEVSMNTFDSLLNQVQETLNLLGATAMQPIFEGVRQGLMWVRDALNTPLRVDEIENAVTKISETFRNASAENPEHARNMAAGVGAAVDALADEGTRAEAAAQNFANNIQVAFEWGAQAAQIFAEGIASAVDFVIDALNVVGDAITWLLEPHSPPNLLPDLDKWGTQAAQIYLDGWGDADYQVFNKISKIIEDNLRDLTELGKLPQKDLIPNILGSRDTIAKITEEIAKTGKVSQELMASLLKNAGSTADELEAVIKAYAQQEVAAKRAAAAQKAFNDAKKNVEDAEEALNQLLEDRGNLSDKDYVKEVKAARKRLEDAKAVKAAAEEALAVAKAQVDAATTSVKAAEARLKVAQDELSLLKEQQKLLEEASKTKKAGGGGKKGESDEEKAKRRAEEAERRYNEEVSTTEENLARARAELEAAIPGTEEYYDAKLKVHELEEKLNAEAEKAAKAAEKEAAEKQKVTDAEWEYNFALADTAGKIAMLKEKLAGLNPESVEYWEVLGEIAKLERDAAKEKEKLGKKAKEAAKGVNELTDSLGGLSTVLGEQEKDGDKGLGATREKWQAFFDKMQGHWQTFTSFLSGLTLGDVLSGIGMVFTNLYTVLTTLDIKPYLEGFFRSLSAIGGKLSAALQGSGIVDKALGFFSDLRIKLMNAVLSAFGFDPVQPMESLMQEVGGVLTKWKRSLGEMMGSIEYQQIITKGLLTDGLGPLPEKIGNILENIGSKLGPFILGLINSTAAFLYQLLDGFISYFGGTGFDTLLLTLQTAILGVGDWILAQAPGLVSNLLAMIGALFTKIIEYAPIAVVKLQVFLTSIVDWIVNNRQQIYDAILTWVSQIGAWLVTNLPNLGAALGTILGSVMSFLVTLLDAAVVLLMDAVGAFWEWLQSGGTDLVLAALGALAVAIGTFFTTLIDTLVTNYEIIRNKVQTWLSETWNAYTLFKDNWLAKTSDFINGILASIVNWWTNSVTPWFSQAWDDVGTWFSELGTSISDWFTELWVSITGFFDNGWTAVTGWFSAGSGMMMGFLGQTGSNLVESMIGPIKDAMGKLPGWAKGMINPVIDMVNSLISDLNSVSEAVGLGSIPLIPRLARGTADWKGGMALVGEHGPELAYLPKGSRVSPHSSSDTQQMLLGLRSAREAIPQKLLDRMNGNTTQTPGQIKALAPVQNNTITINIPPGSMSKDQKELVKAIADEVLRRLAMLKTK